MPIYYNEAQRLYFLFPAFVLAAVEIVYPSTDNLIGLTIAARLAFAICGREITSQRL